MTDKLVRGLYAAPPQGIATLALRIRVDPRAPWPPPQRPPPATCPTDAPPLAREGALPSRPPLGQMVGARVQALGTQGYARPRRAPAVGWVIGPGRHERGRRLLHSPLCGAWSPCQGCVEGSKARAKGLTLNIGTTPQFWSHPRLHAAAGRDPTGHATRARRTAGRRVMQGLLRERHEQRRCYTARHTLTPVPHRWCHLGPGELRGAQALCACSAPPITTRR
jgi:hypothetical protein